MKRACWLAVLCVASNAAAQTGPPATEEWYLPTPDGCRVYVYEVGQGPDTVVVLNGGFGQDITYMLPAFDGIEDHYRVIFYDPRGALRSACPDSLISLQTHVDDLDRLRKALRIDRMNIAGHSMGTVLAMTYLQQHPGNVRALALMGAIPAKSFAEDQGTTFASRMVDGRTKMMDRPAVREVLHHEGLDKDTAQMTPQEGAHLRRIRLAGMAMYHVERWRQLRSFYNASAGAAAGRAFAPTYDFTPAIAAHVCPVWILIGDHDYVDYGLPRHRRWIAEVPNAHLAVIPNAGHVFWLDDPRLTDKYLLDALGTGRQCR